MLLRHQSRCGNGGHIEEHLLHILLRHVNRFGSGFVLLIVKELHHRHIAFKMSDRLGCPTGIGGTDCDFVIFVADGSVAVRYIIIGFWDGLPITVGRNAAIDNISADKHRSKHRHKHRHNNHEFLSNRLVQRSPSFIIILRIFQDNIPLKIIIIIRQLFKFVKSKIIKFFLIYYIFFIILFIEHRTLKHFAT